MPNIDRDDELIKEAEKLMRIAEQAEGLSGYGVTPAFLEALLQLLKERERKAHMQGWHEGRLAANNPQMEYGYSTAEQLTKEGKE